MMPAAGDLFETASCWLCEQELLEWGSDFLGRAWCIPCAELIAPSRRQRKTA